MVRFLGKSCWFRPLPRLGSKNLCANRQTRATHHEYFITPVSQWLDIPQVRCISRGRIVRLLDFSGHMLPRQAGFDKNGLRRTITLLQALPGRTQHQGVELLSRERDRHATSLGLARPYETANVQPPRSAPDAEAVVHQQLDTGGTCVGEQVSVMACAAPKTCTTLASRRSAPARMSTGASANQTSSIRIIAATRSTRTRKPPPTPQANEPWRHWLRAAVRCGCLPARKTRPLRFERLQQRSLLLAAPAPARSSRAAAPSNGAPHSRSTREVARSRRPTPQARCTPATLAL